MGVPASFSAFQKLFEDSKSLFPDIRARDKEREKGNRPADRGPNGRYRGANPKMRRRVLSWAADALLADLHENESLRDAVIDSFPTEREDALLLVVNPTLEATEDLIEFLSDHPRVAKFALGARKLSDGERIRAVKVKVVPVEDETDAPDKEGEEAKKAEQEQLSAMSGDGGDSTQTELSMPFYRGGAVGPRLGG